MKAGDFSSADYIVVVQQGQQGITAEVSFHSRMIRPSWVTLLQEQPNSELQQWQLWKIPIKI